MNELSTIRIRDFGDIDFYTDDCNFTENGYLDYIEGAMKIERDWLEEYANDDSDYVTGFGKIAIDSETFELEWIDLTVFNNGDQVSIRMYPEDIDSKPIIIKRYFAAKDCSDEYDYENEE